MNKISLHILHDLSHLHYKHRELVSACGCKVILEWLNQGATYQVAADTNEHFKTLSRARIIATLNTL